MPDSVNPRRYDATRRREAAGATRTQILAAARALFIADGYAKTTVAGIAARAGVAPDTVYASVGRKPALFELLVETALSGRDEAVEGEQREYVTQMRAAPDASTKLAIYAEAVVAIQQRLAPLFLALRAAAAAEPQLQQLWHRISERRATNMLALTRDLAVTGELRDDLSHREIADVIWSLNSSEYYAMLVIDRGWTPTRFQRWLHESWVRLLLR